MNLLNLINSWLNINCQITIKYTTILKLKLFHELNTTKDIHTRPKTIPKQLIQPNFTKKNLNKRKIHREAPESFTNPLLSPSSLPVTAAGELRRPPPWIGEVPSHTDFCKSRSRKKCRWSSIDRGLAPTSPSPRSAPAVGDHRHQGKSEQEPTVNPAHHS